MLSLSQLTPAFAMLATFAAAGSTIPLGLAKRLDPGQFQLEGHNGGCETTIVENRAFGSGSLGQCINLGYNQVNTLKLIQNSDTTYGFRLYSDQNCLTEPIADQPSPGDTCFTAPRNQQLVGITVYQP